MNKLDQKAFTLIELLIVIAIIGILVTIVVIAINPVKLIQDSRDSKTRSDMQQIKASMQLFYNDCKNYRDGPLPAAGTVWNGNGDTAGGVALTCSADTTVYMRQMPSVNGLVYTRVDASSYMIVADLSTTQANRSADDTASLTKCGAATNNDAIDYAVCND